MLVAELGNEDEQLRWLAGLWLQSAGNRYAVANEPQRRPAAGAVPAGLPGHDDHGTGAGRRGAGLPELV